MSPSLLSTKLVLIARAPLAPLPHGELWPATGTSTPLVELRLTWNLVSRQHSYPHIPSLRNVVRLVPNKELPLPASSRHAEFSARRLDTTTRLDSGLDVSRPLDSRPRCPHRDRGQCSALFTLHRNIRIIFKRVEFLLFARYVACFRGRGTSPINRVHKGADAHV